MQVVRKHDFKGVLALTQCQHRLCLTLTEVQHLVGCRQRRIEFEFAEVGEGVAILDGDSDTLLPRLERDVPRFEPDWAEDVPRQPPLGFRPPPVVDEPPETMVPGVAGVVGRREIERVIVRGPDGAADDTI